LQDHGMKQAGTVAILAVAVLAAASVTSARGKAAPADLNGLWTNVSATPLERPAAFAGLNATESEARAFLKSYQAANADDDEIGSGASEWWEFGTALLRIDGHDRSSMIVDPADGHLPWSAAGRAARTQAMRMGFDNPEQRPVSERCLAGGSGSSSVPMLPHRSVSLYMFVQTPDHLAIWMEAGHDPRIIPLKGGPRLAANLHPWAGDSTAHWDGRTLVVETDNLNPGEGWKSPTSLYISPEAHITERFTRLSKSEILYAFTVDDPQTFTRPWRAELVLGATKGPIFEYACHEGNYSLPGILAGARRAETAAK
jgi:hypothetical protein